MDIDAYDEGVPSWIDIGEPDIAAAADFYSALFGWECPPGPEEAGGYRVCLLRGRPVAGIGPQMMPDAPPFWASYVNTADVDAVAARVTANGGTVIVPPMDVMDAGRMGVFLDPAGAAFSAWQPGVMIGAGVVNEPGALSWNELVTTDVDGAKGFYGAVFGWGAETADGPMPYTEWKLDGRSIGGMMAKPDTMPAEMPPAWSVYFGVAEVDASAARVTELGGSVLVPGTDIEPGRFAVVADPFGGTFTVFQPKEGLGS